MRRRLDFRLLTFNRFLGSFFNCLSGQVRNNSLRSSRAERLGNGLLSTASSTAAPATAAASAPALSFSPSALLARLAARVGGILARRRHFQRLRSIYRFSLRMARLDVLRLKSFRLRLRVGDRRRSLIRIEISGLQWRRRRLASLLGSLLLTPL